MPVKISGCSYDLLIYHFFKKLYRSSHRDEISRVSRSNIFLFSLKLIIFPGSPNYSSNTRISRTTYLLSLNRYFSIRPRWLLLGCNLYYIMPVILSQVIVNIFFNLIGYSKGTPLIRSRI